MRLAVNFCVKNALKRASIARRNYTTAVDEVAAAPKPIAISLDSLPGTARVSHIAEQICTLSLLETSQLVALLRERLKLPDIVAAMPSAGAASPNAAEAQGPAKPAATPETKTEYRITLDKFDPASKAKVIREIKVILPQLNLVEAKAFVESAPKIVKEKVKKEEAEKIKKTLEELGATITLD